MAAAWVANTALALPEFGLLTAYPPSERRSTNNRSFHMQSSNSNRVVNNETVRLED